MKRITKLLLILIISFLAGVIIIDKFDKREFRFEDFKTAEELILYLKNHYLSGSPTKVLLNALKKSKAECKIIEEKYYTNDTPKNCYKFYHCSYNTGLFSLDPFIDFDISVYEDDKEKLILFGAGRQRTPL